MAQRGIREYHGKKMIAKYWSEYFGGLKKYAGKIALIDAKTTIDTLVQRNPWLKTEKLAVKPDQLFGKRGKHNLILLNATFEQARKWIKERMNKEVTIGKTTGKLSHFLVEPFVPHERNKEYFVAITSNRQGDVIHLSAHGGVDIEEVWDTVATIEVPILSSIDDIEIKRKLPKDIPNEEKDTITAFVKGLFKLYRDLGYAYLEINPLISTKEGLVPVDMVARLDDTTQFAYGKKWGPLEFPAPFGRSLTTEEKFVKNIDEKSGASLKLTILNQKGRVWTIVAGGGASVVYTDTIFDLGFKDQLANYGEYSGNPSTDETYQYAKTIIDLMTREKDPKGKILIIGGGIANFTDVAKTFTGIIKALNEYRQKLIDNKVRIYVRRGGPNYQEGLKNMKDLGKTLGVPIEVFGPEAHMTSIVPMGLKERANK
ncbi:MAG: ATPase [Candidatus Bathyarchaeota archaeon]|nr:MAG: ATPase [Candidatus Bathyarchaeota archaeon]